MATLFPVASKPLKEKAYWPLSLTLVLEAMVTVAVPDLVESATEVAETATVGGVGILAGAV
jgi:hypothetical protein